MKETIYIIFIGSYYKMTKVNMGGGRGAMAFNATFNNISVTSWRLVLLVKETGAPGENHEPVASHWQTLSHNFVSSTPRHEQDLYSQR
jgi:hypothetical protein